VDTVTVRANVPLPELSYGATGRLARTSRVEGLLASRRLTLVEDDVPDPDDVPAGTVSDVVAWVLAAEDPHERAGRAIREEYARPSPRSTLLEQLEDLEDLEASGRDESPGVEPEG